MGLLDWMWDFGKSEEAVEEVITDEDTLEDKNVPRWAESDSRRDRRASGRNAKLEARNEKSENKRAYKLERIKELTAKAYAVGNKRKWLVFLIGIVLAAFAYFKFAG